MINPNSRQISFTLWFMLAFSLLGVLMPSYFIYDTDKTLSWPTVKGKIITSRVQLVMHHSNGTTSEMYRADVRYVYAVDGNGYINDNINNSIESYPDREDVDQIISNYKLGHRVPVAYNPAAPSESVLEPGVPWMIYVFLAIFSPFLIGFGGLAIWQVTRKVH